MFFIMRFYCSKFLACKIKCLECVFPYLKNSVAVNTENCTTRVDSKQISYDAKGREQRRIPKAIFATSTSITFIIT